MKKFLITTLLSLSVLVPLVTSAQFGAPPGYDTGSGYGGNKLTNLNSVINKALDIGDLIIFLTISLSVIYIIVNTFRYFIAKGADDRREGGMAILYGVIALFVIFSIWGFVYILRNTFEFQSNQMPPLNDIQLKRIAP